MGTESERSSCRILKVLVMTGRESNGCIKRLIPSVLVFAVSVSSLLVFSVPLYCVGKSVEDSRQFLRNYRPPNDHELYIHIKMKYCVNSNETNDAVFLGDSTCYCDVVTREFEKQTGISAYNLGCQGMLGLSGHILLLDYYLLHHPRPRILVLCVSPSFLGIARASHLEPEIRARFDWCYGPGGEETRPSHSDSFLYYVRDGAWYLYGICTGGLSPRLDEVKKEQSWESSYNTRLRYIQEERGYCGPKTDDYILNPGPLEDPPPPFLVLRENIDELRDLSMTCRKAGIKLLIRFTPVLSQDAPADIVDLQDWEASMKRAFPEVCVGSPEVLKYDKTCFWDKWHCNGKGALRFTSAVALEVHKLLERK
jgi:hypothetical protein